MDIVQDIVDTATVMCRLDTDHDMPLQKAIACLSEIEKTRMMRFVFERDQKRFARGRGFLRDRLGRCLGMPASSVPLEQGRNGKPFVRDALVAFNLSHSQDLAVLAIRAKGSIGVDLELSDRAFNSTTDLIDLGKRCFTPLELEVLQGCSAQTHSIRFLQFWTAKEARMKLWGDGMTLDPKRIILQLKEGIPIGYQDEPHVWLHVIPTVNQNAICCYAESDLFDDPSRSKGSK